MRNRTGNVLLVSDDLSGQKLDRLEVEALTEDWIQRLVDAYPAVLPAGEIDDRIGAELVTLGREVGTPAGAIDNVLISRDAVPVVCEAKLWRNPESRRKVVGQVLDYAAHVRRWDHSDFERLAQQRWGKRLFEVAGEGPEDEWYDRLDRNLRHGRMCLMLVGDGMREVTVDLVDALDGHPDFEFRIGLVELRVHALPDGARVVVPLVATRSTEVVRAIVRVEADPSARVSITPVPREQAVRRGALTEAAFFETMAETLGQESVRVARAILDQVPPPLEVFPATKSLTLKVPDPAGSGKLISLVTIPAATSTYVWLDWTEPQLQALWNDPQAVDRVSGELLGLFDRFGARRTPRSSSVDLPAVAGREQEFVDGLASVANLIASESVRHSQR